MLPIKDTRSTSFKGLLIEGPILKDNFAQDAFVEFEKVQKSYDGETLVVKDLNLKISKGEFLTMH